MDNGKQLISDPLYLPLSTGPHEIRVLDIVDSTGETLECQLHTVVLDKDLEFSALSYVWGDPTDPSNQATVAVNGRGKRVTKSLELAIRHAGKAWNAHFPARPQASFRLWADALCINQDDAAEKNHQVGLMARIFSRADVVLAWLGPDPNGHIHLALQSLNTVFDAIHRQGREPETGREASDLLRNHTGFYEDPVLKGNGLLVLSRCFAVSVFYALPNWSRVWICQEFALAKRLVMFTPSAGVDFDDIGAGSRVFMLGYEDIMRRNFWDVNHIGPRTAPWSFQFRPHLNRLFMLRRAYRQYSVTPRGFSTMGFRCLASDRRDHIFGIMSLINLDLQVDYTKSFARLQIEFAASVLRCKELVGFSLWSILLQAAPRIARLQGAPSWVPFPSSDGPRATFINPGGSNSEIRHARGEEGNYVDGRALCLQGTRLGIVRDVWDFGSERPEGQDFADWVRGGLRPKLARGRVDVYTLQAIALLFFREHQRSETLHIIAAVYLLIMVAGYDDDDTIHPDSLHLRGVLASLGFDLGRESFMDSFFKIFSVSESSQRDSHVRDYLSEAWRGGTATWKWANDSKNRTFKPCPNTWDFHRPAVMEGGELGGRLVAVAVDTEVGDSICLFRGCPYPIVLRRHAEEEWRMIGPSGIAEIREGRYVDKVELPAGTKVETFRVV
ncbi:hypothetical protein RB595_003393 [Gaeumannomyces hyphopodioides]